MLLGGEGRDTILGQDGADWLIGGDGEIHGGTISPLGSDNQADYLAGGDGNDTYVMTGGVPGGSSINTISGADLRATVNYFIDTIYDADGIGTIRHQFGATPALNNTLDYNAYESFVNAAGMPGTPLAFSASNGLEIFYNPNFVSGLDGPPWEPAGVVSGAVKLRMRSQAEPTAQSDYMIMLGGYGGAGFMEFHGPVYAIEVPLSGARVASNTMALNDPIFYIGNDTNETIGGAELDDALYGEAGNDSISGGDGSDFLRGDGGDDTLAGDAGDDALGGDDGADSISGGDGSDC
jgi:Ca2+-binding RTX toxin-like protein